MTDTNPDIAAVRRSTRTRSKAITYYDEAAKAVKAQRNSKNEDLDSDDEEDHDEEDNVSLGSGDKKIRKPRKKKSKATNDDEDMEEGEEVSEDEGEEDDEDFRTNQNSNNDNKRKRTPPKKIASSKKAKADREPSSKRGAAKKRPPVAARKSTAKGPSGNSNSGKITKARITSSLNALAKKVLENGETPENSLVAALLASSKPIPKIPSVEQSTQFPSYIKINDGSVVSKIVSLTKATTLPQIDGIARQLVGNFDPNAMHIQLLNLLFRSVGGTVETNLPDGTDLEELEDNEWDELMTKVVKAMVDETGADQTLLCADHPPPPPHDQQQKIGLIAYRAIYKEFWYRLGHVLLAHSPSTSSNTNTLVEEDVDSDDDEIDQESDNESLDSLDFDRDENDEKEAKKKTKSKKETNKQKKKAPTTSHGPEKFSSNRFQLEMMRDLISRVTEFVTVGQPDLRSSGTLAIYQLGKACLERTYELETKIQIASRQCKAAKQNQAKSKMEQLKLNIDAWKRHKAELEEIVTGQVIQAVFINRYRDANTTVRKESLDSLSEMSLIRPDIFLVDTYLKYLGWMTHDKEPVVRKSALNALLAPFKMYQEQIRGASTSKKSLSSSPLQIEIESMKHVTLKFLSRLVDCTHDADDVGVQESAMHLLLEMGRVEFLEECQDDDVWDSINMKCLDMHSSPKVRRDALYFVFDQLAAFDSTDEPANQEKLSERFTSLAGWVANILADGDIDVDEVHIHLVDYVVESLLIMPEHRDIVSDLTMMVQAIRKAIPRKDDKEEITKQRVMLRMMLSSTKISFENRAFPVSDKPASKKGKNPTQDENYVNGLSSSLLQSLPSLLTTFKSDVVAMRDVTKLPPMIASSILGLPARKADFQNVLKSLCQMYLDFTDKVTLQNIASTLSQWVEGDHTRVSEVKMQLKRLSHSIVDRLMDLFRESDPESAVVSRKSPRSKKRNGEKGGDMFAVSPEAETEQAIASLMLRLKILLMQCRADHLFEDTTEEDEENELDGLFKTISEAMGQRLKERKNTADNVENGTVASASSIWMEADPNLHEEVAESIDMSLRVLLLIIAQELAETLEARKDYEATGEYEADLDTSQLFFVRHRNTLVKLLMMCFEHFIEDETEASEEQRAFSTRVQTSAGQVTSDLRSLFPYDAAEAADPVRRAMSLQEVPDQSILLGGFARWFQQQESNANEPGDQVNALDNSLTPLCRSIAVNMKEFFRREMALALMHIHGRGSLSTQTVSALIRLIRRENPVRLLESHMACLRMSFDDWLASEPEEPVIDCPTEKDVAAFEELEKHHQEIFSDLEHLAGKLAPTLGVVKLKNDIKRSFLSFMKEGIRFSFEEDDVYALGARLPFLTILLKYSSWLKKDKEDLEEITDFLLLKESELRSHSDFNEIHEDDLEVLASFKESLGIKRVAESSYYDEETTIATRTTIATPSPSSSRRRGSTVGSRRSMQSNMSNLSPLEEGDSQEEESPTPQKQRRLHSSQHSLQSSLTRTMVEEDEEEGSDVDEIASTA